MHVGIRGPLYSAKDLADDGILGFQVVRCDDYQLDGLAGSSSGCAPAWPTGPSTSRSTSTCSTPRTPPAPAPRRRAE